MDYLSKASALRDRLVDPSLESPTLIRLLKLESDSKKNTWNVVTDSTFGDDIVSHITADNGVDNGSLVEAEAHVTIPRLPFLQILFLSSHRDDQGCTTNRLRITDKTLRNISEKFNVPTTFLDGILKPSIWSDQSGASYHCYSAPETSTHIDGFYHYFNQWDKGPLHVWFSYNITTKSTTYILVDCPDSVEYQISQRSQDQSDHSLHRPLAIDYLIAEACVLWRKVFINTHWEEIFEWHDQSGGSMDPPLRPVVSKTKNLQSLHRLSRTWNMLYEDLGDLEERLDLLISISEKLDAAGIPNASSAKEAFHFLRGRNHLRRRWVTSFGERTKLIMNFVFSLAAQKSSETNTRNAGTNLDIARLTKDIADETAKDNSSMITIATMTMLFLPGTFISAIFSMVFFNWGTNSDGESAFTVSGWIWLYFAVTIPVTLLVFAIYLFWRGKREVKMASKLLRISEYPMEDDSDVDLELGNIAPSQDHPRP